MAQRPKTWIEWADFFSKSVIAVAALAVTIGTTILTQFEQRRANAAKELYDTQKLDIELDNASRSRQSSDQATTEFILKYVPQGNREQLQLKVALAYCKNPLISSNNADLCKGVSEVGLANLAQSAKSVKNAASSAAQRSAPEAYFNSRVAAQQNANVAAAEVARPSSSGRWFAVVGTLPLSATPDSLRELAEQLNTRLETAGLPANDVHIYRTKISKSFAFTSGIDKSEADAQARARMLRRAGFTDAFAQPDRGWERSDELS